MEKDVFIFPVSFAQQRLWFLDQLEPGSAVYNVSTALRLRGPLQVAALELSLHEIVRRHETLRTTFAVVDGNPVQCIAPYPTVTLPVVDLLEWPATEREAQVHRLITEETQRSFDLTRGPLMRTTLFRLGTEEHILVLALHHIISDGWSRRILLRELAVLYEAFATEKPSPLTELPIQYADFAVWQRQWLQGAVLETQLAYWKHQLVGAPAVLEVPTDSPRPVVQTYRGGQHAIELPLPLSKSLTALSHQAGVTLFMTLLATFHMLLHRYTGQEDIVVGSPIANRTRAEIEGLIGFFVNTLVLRTDLSGNPTFHELLERVREVCLGAYTHQDLPFEKLVEELQPERDLSRTPIFQVFFNMINIEEQDLTLRALKVELLFAAEPPAKFDLALYVRQRDATIHLELRYNTALFSPERMRELLAQYQHLLSQVVEHPEHRIGSYSLVTSAARQLLPDPCRVLPEPPHEVVTRLFAQWAQHTPEHIAVSQGSHTWTYRTLAARANRLARTFVAQGVAKGDVVAVYGHRSVGVIASMLGVFWSGGILLLIDPQLPTHRQRVMFREAAVKHLVYVGNEAPEASWLAQHTTLNLLSVDAATGSPGHAEADVDLQTVALPEVEPDDAAYIFFTSGSTGVPKGVLGWHKGLSHFLQWQGDTFGIGPQERVAQLIHLSFDAVLRDVFLPLTRGATLCVPNERDTLDAPSLIRWLERERVSLVHTIPTLAQAWLAQVPADVCLRSLRWVFFSGEPLTEMVVRQWRVAFPRSAIVNLYGPTETTLVKCYYVVPPDALPGIQPAGWPLPQTQALVLAAHSRLCGIGEPGEIVLRTPFRTLGYINAPDDQRQRFVQNPYREDAGDWLYYTGDRGRYRPDGMLEILGRLDEQVKIRGIRIEPSEVTATLAQHPAVHACVVVPQKDASGQPVLVAYVVAPQLSAVTPGMLRAYLSHHLPAAMIPVRFVLLEQLPLTPNGKVDRQALPMPDWTVPEWEGTFVAPRTPMEEILAATWAEVLKREQVGVCENFFALGGHSLLATQLMARVCEALQVELPLRRFFEDPTIAGLAVVVTQWQTEQLASEAAASIVAELEALSPTEVQSRLANEAQS